MIWDIGIFAQWQRWQKGRKQNEGVYFRVYRIYSLINLICLILIVIISSYTFMNCDIELLIDFIVYVCLFTKLEDCDSCNFDFISDYTYTTMYNANSLVLTCLWIHCFIFYCYAWYIGALWNIKGTLPMYCILSLPSLPFE